MAQEKPMTRDLRLRGKEADTLLQVIGGKFRGIVEQFRGSPEAVLRRWASAGIVFTLLLISLVSFLAWRSTRRSEKGEVWVVHTLTVELVLESGLGHAVYGEYQARGFAVTGRENLLNAYREQQEELAKDLAAVRRLTSDNTSQQRRLDLLESQVNALNQIQRSIDDERQRAGKAPSDEELLAEKSLLDAVRGTFAGMRGEEERLLVLRVGETQRAAQLTRKAILSGALAGIVSLILAGSILLYQINRSVLVQRRLRAEEQQSAESKRLEEEAHRSSRYARSLIEACLDPLVTISREGKITDVNDAAAAATGTSRESLIGSDFSDFFTDPQSARRGYEQAFAQGAVKDYPLAIRDAAGNVTDVQYNASVFKDEAGNVQGVFAVARDITERKRSEVALRESEERFRLLVEPVKDYGIYMLDPEGRVVTWNVGAERIKGYKAEEVLGRSYSMFFPPEAVVAGIPSKELAAAARDGRFEAETRRIRKDGTMFWALVTLTAIYGHDGMLLGFAKVTRDMTSQKEAAEALLRLNAQLEHYRIVVEHVDGHAIYTLDAEGFITSWGAGAQKTSGITAEEVMGRHYSIFFTAADVLAGVPQQDLAEAARTGCCARDGWMVRPGGERRWASGVLNAVRDESGKLTGFIRVGRDMTAQKEAAETLLSLNAQLERYRIVVEHIDEYAIYTLDAEGIITSWGTGAQRVSGATAEEVIGQHYSFFFPAAAVLAGEPQRELAEAARTGRYAMDAWMVTPDGDRKWSSGVLNSVRDENGVLTGFIRVARDMTLHKRAIDDLRQANRALAESEERFRLLVEPVTDYGIIMLDPEGLVVTWNLGAERLKGYKAEEVLGRNFSIFFLPDAVEAGMPSQELATAARDGRFETETWRVRKDGTKFWALVTLTAVYWQDGTLRGFAKVFRDMTEQKEAAETLRQANRALVESEERFRLLVEPVKDYGIYMLDPEGRVVTWNEGAERSEGYKAAEVLGRNFSMFFLPEDADAGLPAQELATAARDGRFETESWCLRRDGTKFWALMTLTAIHGQDRTLRGFAKVTRDMTTHKQATEDLRQANRALVESEERFRLLVEPVKEYAIYMLDPEGRILTWNEGAERSKGYKASEVVGRNFAMFYLPEDAQAGLPTEELAAAARDGRFETAAWRLRKDGEMFWGLVTLTALHLPDGALRGFATVTRDMTKQKEMEDSLQRLAADLENRVEQRTRDLEAAMKELHRKNEEVEAFVYIVSHDLRAPLVNVQGFVRELDDSSKRLTALLDSCSLPEQNRGAVHEILNDEIAGALHFISASATKFERLIDALIGLSRHGRQSYLIVQVDVEELVSSALATFKQAINEAGAEFEVGQLPAAYADVTALGQVFSNLIGNALKYRSPLRPLKVQVGGRIEDGTVHYWVRDNGLGIPEFGKARLFQVFQRLHPQAAAGEGMGLAIVHRIVERHQGKVWAESREGEETTFHFSLPSKPGPTTNIDRETTAHGTN
jgi:PAS domain S-box-containing protein